MRTNYPKPKFADIYKFKLVDSTFIHAIHLARSSASWTYVLGVSFQSNQDEIKWYNVTDPIKLYDKLTDPKQSPGFTFNNSVKGKTYSATQVAGTTFSTPPSTVAPKKYNVNTKPEAVRLLEEWKAQLNAKVAPTLVMPKVDKTPLPKDPGYCEQSGYGTLLDVCQKVAYSSCISYLALGYNRKDKNFVVYFTLKSLGAQNMMAFFTDDANTYRDWTNSESLGRFYNRSVKFQEDIFSVRGAAKA